MIKQNLIIYSIPILSEILRELEFEINFNIIEISNFRELNKQKYVNSLIIINQNKSLELSNATKLDFPIKLSKLIEKVNIQ